MRKYTVRNVLVHLSSGLMIVAGLGSVNAVADESPGIEEIVVTATKRTENLKEIPMTISVLGQEAIEIQGITNAQDIARRVPGLIHSQAGKNLTPHFSLRGIAVSSNPENVNTPVSTYLDDFPITSSNSSTNPEPNLYDVKRVEVLKGPQGTLYGSGTLGGIVRVVTNKPDPGAFDYSMSTDFGSTSGSLRQRYNGMVNIPLGENAAVRFVGYYRDEEGWFENTGTGQKDADQLDEEGLRASLRWLVNDNLTTTFSAIYQKSEPEDVSLSVSRDNIGEGSTFKPQFSSTEFTALNLTIEYDLGWAELTSSTNAFDTDSVQENDLTSILAATPFPFPWGMIRDDTHENFIQEIRLVSTNDSKLSWVVGAYYSDRETDFGQDHHTTDELVAARNLAGLWTTSLADNVFIEASKRVNSDIEKAIFAEFNYDLTDTLKLAVGARYGEVEVKDVRHAIGVEGISAMIQTNLRWFLGEVGAAPQLPVYDLNEVFPQGVRPYGELLPDGTYINQTWAVDDDYSTFKISLAWQASDDINVYALAAKGFRGPQINGSSTTNGGVSLLDPDDLIIPLNSEADTLWNYELGLKARWFGGKLDTNISAYFIDWEDIQQQVSRTSDAASLITNAGQAETYGLEVELLALPTPKLELGLNFSIAEAEIKELTDAEAALTGFQLGESVELTSPDFSASAFMQYTTPVFDGNEFYLRTDIQHVDGYANKGRFVPGSPGVVDAAYEESDSYTNVNLSFGLQSEKWTASLYGENVLDNDDIIYVYPAVFLTNRYGTLRPRTWGLRLTYRM
ncbi:TonB-dependent receptor [Gammaproteobacteria bacterium]|nr:TonB-dependent receptor [Gammaproteobacteria bacterium]